MNRLNCGDILNKALAGIKPSEREIAYLLSMDGADERETLFRTARALREKYFGNRVFLYGFVYFSTYCKNDCAFCNYRVSGGEHRYRKSMEDIVHAAVELKESGVHLIDLTMGEDPYYYRNPGKLLDIIRRVKEATGLYVMVSPGVVPHALIDEFKKTGALWYALYQETYSRELFLKMRVSQSFEARYDAKLHARETGLLVEEGLLTGAGDDAFSLAHSILSMERVRPSQVRVMTYIPPGGGAGIDFGTEILAIAVMRVLYPKLLIPASLDVEGLGGLGDRLGAGANVVTSLIPPGSGFNGVANSSLDIDFGRRTVSGIAETLGQCGLTAAEAGEYRDWVREQKCMC